MRIDNDITEVGMHVSGRVAALQPAKGNPNLALVQKPRVLPDRLEECFFCGNGYCVRPQNTNCQYMKLRDTDR